MAEIRPPYRHDLDTLVKKTYLNGIFATGDALANCFAVELYKGNAPYTIPSGATVKGYFVRNGKDTIELPGTKSGNVVSVTLNSACYNQNGPFTLTIKVLEGSAITTVFYGEGSMAVSRTGTTVNPGFEAVEYYKFPVNLLDNSNFANPINQRGETSYGGTWVKCIDRWICTTGEGTKVWVSAGYLSVPDKGVIVQPVAVKTADVVGKTYTFAFGITNGRIYACSGTIQAQGDSEYITQCFASVAGYQLEVYTVNNSEYLYARIRNISGYSAPIKWVALYEGEYTAETLPPYVPKPYMVELAECQRYYENSWFNKGKSGQRQFMANCISYSQADCVIPFRVPKRVAPTITFHPEGNYTEWQIYNGSYFGVGSVTAQNRDGINAFMARITKGDADTSTWTAGLGIAARGHWEASAEL